MFDLIFPAFSEKFLIYSPYIKRNLKTYLFFLARLVSLRMHVTATLWTVYVSVWLGIQNL